MQEPYQDDPILCPKQTETVVSYPDPIVSLTASQLFDALYLLQARGPFQLFDCFSHPLPEPSVSYPFQVLDKTP
jgi:hypothetical protein